MNPNRSQFFQQSDSADESDKTSFPLSFSTNFLATKNNSEALSNIFNCSNALFGFNQQQQEQQVSITNNFLVQQNQQVLFNNLNNYVNNVYLAQATAQYVAQKIYAEKRHNMSERPPAEPNMLLPSMLKPQEYWTAGNRIFNDESNYLKYLSACDKASNAIRASIPDSDVLHPLFYGSDFPKYELFGNDFKFNYASPGTLEPSKFPTRNIHNEDYDEMRRDFESNGQEVVEEISKVNVFENFDFPPLQIHPEQVTKLQEIWEDRCNLPIRSMNTPRKNFEISGSLKTRGIVKQPFEEVSLRYSHFHILLLESFAYSIVCSARKTKLMSESIKVTHWRIATGEFCVHVFVCTSVQYAESMEIMVSITFLTFR